MAVFPERVSNVIVVPEGTERVGISAVQRDPAWPESSTLEANWPEAA